MILKSLLIAALSLGLAAWALYSIFEPYCAALRGAFGAC